MFFEFLTSCNKFPDEADATTGLRHHILGTSVINTDHGHAHLQGSSDDQEDPGHLCVDPRTSNNKTSVIIIITVIVVLYALQKVFMLFRGSSNPK